MPKRQKTNPKTLGHNVRKARKAQKFTIEQLAEKVGMKASYIEDLENDEITDIPADVLFRIANALGTTIADLRNLPVRIHTGDAEPGEPLHYRKTR